MAIMKILTYPNPLLKQKSAPVTDFEPQAQRLFDDLIETMHAEDGVGLAAPQVGVLQRILIACPAMREGDEYVIVNPEIYELEKWARKAALAYPAYQEKCPEPQEYA